MSSSNSVYRVDFIISKRLYAKYIYGVVSCDDEDLTGVLDEWDDVWTVERCDVAAGSGR